MKISDELKAKLPNPDDIRFPEFLFVVIPHRVEKGECPAGDPVAKLSKQFAYDRNWPMGADDADVVAAHVLNSIWRKHFDSSVVPKFMHVRATDGHAVATNNLRLKLGYFADEAAGADRVVRLAWTDYETFISKLKGDNDGSTN